MGLCGGGHLVRASSLSPSFRWQGEELVGRRGDRWSDRWGDRWMLVSVTDITHIINEKHDVVIDVTDVFRKNTGGAPFPQR